MNNVKPTEPNNIEPNEITNELVNPDTVNNGFTNETVKRRGNVANLNPVRTNEEARRRGRNGGIKSGEARRNKKTMRETLQNALSIELDPKKLAELGADTELMNGETSVLSAIVASTIREAINGDPRAIQFVRDSIGEQPRQEITQEIITKEDTELLNRLKSSLLA